MPTRSNKIEKPEVKKTWVQILPICVSNAKTIRTNPILELDGTVFFNSSLFLQIK
jgi:hypothetical protein